MLMASARLRTPSQRSSRLKLSPPRMMCRWLSISPGRTRRPLRSTTLVFGPASAKPSLPAPTATKRPSRMATALGVGRARVSVVKRPWCRIRSALVAGSVMDLLCLDEREEVRIDDLRVRRAHAVRKPPIDFQGAVLDELRRQQRRVGDWHDLIIVTVHDQHRHADRFEILREIRFRKGLDAVVVRLGAAHHSLAPPIVDHALRYLGARAVEAKKRPGGNLPEELRPICAQVLSKTIKHFDRQSPRLLIGLDHGQWHRAAEHCFCVTSFTLLPNL